MWNRARHKRAFTVIEVLVFAVILLLLVGSIALVLQGGMKYMRTGAAYQDAQRQVFVGMQKFREDLSNSTPVRREPQSPMVDSDHIIFLSPIPEAPAFDWTYDGSKLEYHAWLCYFHDPATQELVRFQTPLAPPSRSNDLGNTPPLADFQALPGGTNRKVIARGINEVRISDGLNSQQVSIRLSATISTGTNKNTTVVSRSMVTLPNS